MSKNIVLCSDGTGGTVMKNRGTNVWKIYEAVDVNGHKHGEVPPQIAFYDDGIGTEELKVLKMLGGGLGLGLGRNVRQLYSMLCRTYEPGDNIFLFGFSRGAYTMRILARLITRCGVINCKPGSGAENNLDDGQLKARVDKAYKVFRKHHFRRFGRKPDSPDGAMVELRHWLEEKGQGKPLLYDDVHVKVLGLWDTVSAIGLPFAGMTWIWNSLIFPFRFADETLDPLVDKACHALAIDDERKTFHPEVWQEKDEKNPERIEQAWFAGVHSNVGGGYPKQGMSLVSLDWMMTNAEEHGLRFIKSMRENYRDLQNVNDKLYNSRAGLAAYFHYKPRDIARICREKGVAPRIHSSVFERFLDTGEAYAPGNLPSRFEIVKDPKATEPHPMFGLAFRLQGLGILSDEVMKSVGGSVEEYADSGKPLTPAARRAIFVDVQPKLLDKVKGWVRLRQLSQYLFYLLSAFVLWAVWKLYDPMATPKGTIIAAVILLILVLPLVAAPPYFMGSFARKKLQKTFSDYWRKGEDTDASE